MPAQIEISAAAGADYRLLFVAKGGGSANKTFLFQQTTALLRPEKMRAFLAEKIATLGAAACPPYHLAIVIGGLSAEQTLKTVKLASCRALDGLPEQGDKTGRAFRDRALEQEVLAITRELGGRPVRQGKYFCHDVRVIRLPRHAGSLPVGLGVSCSADRQAKALITAEGIFLERLEEHPEAYLPELDSTSIPPVAVDLNQPLDVLRRQPRRYRSALASVSAGRWWLHGTRPMRCLRKDRGGDPAGLCANTRLLRRARENAERHGKWRFRADHGCTDGRLYGGFPGGGRLVDQPWEEQPQPGGRRAAAATAASISEPLAAPRLPSPVTISVRLRPWIWRN